ncbi:MAG: heme o synthase [Vicinamibacterales bacterium]
MESKPGAVAYGKPGIDAHPHSRLGDIVILSKLRVNALVVATAVGGYYMARPDPVDGGVIAWVSVGTALVASGASAFNQIYERRTDTLMARTSGRPIAAGRMSPAQGAIVAAAFSAIGLACLIWGANQMAAAVALATLVSYAAIYTPLKRRTSLSTVVGAVPGALPPLIGWAAAGGSLTGVAPWSLFVLMFLWQLPHFLAIAWMFREDYARAGMPMLTVVDKDGSITGRQTLLWAAALVPASQLPFLFRIASPTYAIGALVLGLAQLVLAFRFARHRSIANARALFYGSIVYLPLLWLLMALGRP